MEIELSQVIQNIIQTSTISYEIIDFEKDLHECLSEKSPELFSHPVLEKFIEEVQKSLKPNTILTMEDSVGIRIAAFCLPDDAKKMYFMGPWFSNTWSPESINEVETRYGSHVLQVVQKFAQRNLGPSLDLLAILKGVLSCPPGVKPYEIVELPLNFKFMDPGAEVYQPGSSKVTKQYMEEKLRLEKELLSNIVFGNFKEALSIYQQQKDFDTFIKDPLKPLDMAKRSLHRYNVLFSSAISNANVHPAYVYQLYAAIENAIDRNETANAMDKQASDMIKEYCSLVSQQSLKNYTPLIQNAINYINLNIDEPLSLNIVAKKCHISASYLSSLFKKETGKTLTDYIAHKRIEMAKFMLQQSQESITAIAAKVGFSDINYFTRTFKKTTGITPSAYRERSRQAKNA